MNSKIKLALSLLTIVGMVRAYAEASVSMDDAETKGVKKIDCLRVNEQLRVCGDALIDGVLTLASQPVISLAIGTPGVPGIGGDLAYGAIASIITQTIVPGGSVVFNIIPPFVNNGTVDTAAGITVVNAGIYRLEALVLGLPYFVTDPLFFQLQANGVAIPGATFQSSIASGGGVTGETLVVTGFGIIPLPAGAVLTVVNVSADNVVLPTISAPFNAAPVTNAVFTVERIA